MAGFNPFGSVPVPKKKRTNFNESFELAGTFPLSKVCPVCFIDTLPGSSWNINVYNLTKLETLIAPAMQRVNASLIWMKMPKRLIFKHFKKWYSGGSDGEDNHQKPHIHLCKVITDLRAVVSDTGYLKDLTEVLFGPGSLWSYIGLPVPLFYEENTGQWQVLSLSSMDRTLPEDCDPNADFIDLMPLMGYQYLFDTYFMDQSLSRPVFEEAEEGNFKLDRPVDYRLTDDVHFVVGKAEDIPEYVDYYMEYSGNDLSEGGEISTADFLGLLYMFNRAWQKEYFTSALPTPQRGPEVMINMVREGDTAEVEIPNQAAMLQGGTSSGMQFGFNDAVSAESFLKTGTQGGRVVNIINNSEGNRIQNIYGNLQGMDEDGQGRPLTGTAALPNLSPIAITAFRNLFKLQSFLEKNNIGGGRFIETILAQWAERVPDFTVQRPQFVRATSLPVQISEVTATANSQGTSSFVGDQAGRARTQGNLGRVHIYTQEPSFIFGLYVVTAPPAYVGQGIPRFFQHVNRFDEPWPDFQHIGEQAIKARELYYPFRNTNRIEEDFGYQQRFSEYKYMPNRYVGYFQTSLSFWHMGRMFNDMPRLNADFITQNLDPRIFAVQTDHPVTASFYFDAQAKLKLSKFSTPKLV